ncbi:MAG: hypothetical protein D6689_04680 [Deltaproteobacteria bacterium]|nr:MAG: hypothetical protein D6689_04680 [Deltaproteobacteria bacterium]
MVARGVACALAVWSVACDATAGDVLTALGDAGDGRADARAAVDAAATPDGGGADAGGCAAMVDGPCPAPGGVGITVCGRVLDVEDTSIVPGGGTVTVRFFNAVDFPGGPSLAEATPDACGWFVAQGVTGLIPGLLVLTTDDAGAGDVYEPVLTIVPASTGSAVRVNAYTLRADTDRAWSAAAGLGGATFSDMGALALIFLDASQPPLFPFLSGRPAAGVTITEGGTPQPGDDYYFADGGPLSRSVLSPAAGATGANGSGLLIGTQPLQEYGGQRAGCTFGTAKGVGPGVVQIQELYGTCN